MTVCTSTSESASLPKTCRAAAARKSSRLDGFFWRFSAEALSVRCCFASLKCRAVRSACSRLGNNDKTEI